MNGYIFPGISLQIQTVLNRLVVYFYIVTTKFQVIVYFLSMKH